MIVLSRVDHLTMPRSQNPTDLVPGTLEMLILQTLTIQPMHGYAIARHIADRSQDVLIVEQGSLYPALERLLAKGLASAKWGESPTGRKARYYTITAAGRKKLGQEISAFDNVLAAIARVMERAWPWPLSGGGFTPCACLCVGQ